MVLSRTDGSFTACLEDRGLKLFKRNVEDRPISCHVWCLGRARSLWVVVARNKECECDGRGLMTALYQKEIENLYAK